MLFAGIVYYWVYSTLDADQLPRSLEDVDAAIINTNYALEAKLNPVEDSLIIEGSESPYANIITIRPEDTDREDIKILIETLQSEDVKNFIEENYKGAVVPACVDEPVTSKTYHITAIECILLPTIDTNCPIHNSKKFLFL